MPRKNSEYKYDIIQAILRIREVEGRWARISFIPNPIYKDLRFKEYPHTDRLIPDNIIKQLDLLGYHEAIQGCLNELMYRRVVDYFMNYSNYDEIDDDGSDIGMEGFLW